MELLTKCSHMDTSLTGSSLKDTAIVQRWPCPFCCPFQFITLLTIAPFNIQLRAKQGACYWLEVSSSNKSPLHYSKRSGTPVLNLQRLGRCSKTQHRQFIGKDCSSNGELTRNSNTIRSGRIHTLRLISRLCPGSSRAC